MSSQRIPKGPENQRKSKVAFRSDLRDPAEIFVTGFKRHSKSCQTTAIRYRQDEMNSGDTDPSTGISLSWRISAVTYFPFDAGIESFWIYVVNVDLNQANDDQIFQTKISTMKIPENKIPPTNTTESGFSYIHGRQTLDAMTLMDDNRKQQLRRMLFADEFAVKQIKPENIFFAVRCTRQLNFPRLSDELLGDVLKGGTYVLGPDLVANLNISKEISQKRIQQIRNFLEEEINLTRKRKQRMPSSFGFHPSEPESKLFIAKTNSPLYARTELSPIDGKINNHVSKKA